MGPQATGQAVERQRRILMNLYVPYFYSRLTQAFLNYGLTLNKI